MTSTAAVLVFGLMGLAGFATILAEKNGTLDARNKELDIQRKAAVKAEQLARKEAAKTKKSEAETKAVLGFFQDKVLAAVLTKDQDGGLGIDATIRAAMDAAEQGLDKSFADQPTVEASIRNTLGDSYYELSEPSLAIRQYERSRQLRRAILGLDHPDTLVSMSNLAECALRRGPAR